MSSPANIECKFCGVIVSKDEHLLHLRRCEFRDVICSDCKELVPLNNFESHQEFECRMRPVADHHEKMDSDDDDNVAHVQSEIVVKKSNNWDSKVKLDCDEPSSQNSRNRNGSFDNHHGAEDHYAKRKRSRSRSPHSHGRSDSRSRGLKIEAPGGRPRREPTSGNTAKDVISGGLPPIVYQNGNIYTGERLGNTREGKGILTCHDKGETYEGIWHEDKLSGFGTARYRTGGQYSGMWLDGKRHGHGVESSTNGNHYMGEFARNLKHGKGMMRYAEGGSTYDGDWVNGRHEGYGVLWTSGILYRGEFREGKKDGRGVSIFPTGKIEDQYWSQGRHVPNPPHSHHQIEYHKSR